MMYIFSLFIGRRKNLFLCIDWLYCLVSLSSWKKNPRINGVYLFLSWLEEGNLCYVLIDCITWSLSLSLHERKTLGSMVHVHLFLSSLEEGKICYLFLSSLEEGKICYLFMFINFLFLWIWLWVYQHVYVLHSCNTSAAGDQWLQAHLQLEQLSIEPRGTMRGEEDAQHLPRHGL